MTNTYTNLFKISRQYNILTNTFKLLSAILKYSIVYCLKLLMDEKISFISNISGSTVGFTSLHQTPVTTDQ